MKVLPGKLPRTFEQRNDPWNSYQCTTTGTSDRVLRRLGKFFRYEHANKDMGNSQGEVLAAECDREFPEIEHTNFAKERIKPESATSISLRGSSAVKMEGRALSH